MTTTTDPTNIGTQRLITYDQYKSKAVFYTVVIWIAITIGAYFIPTWNIGNNTVTWWQLTAMCGVLYIVFSYRFWDPVPDNQNGSLQFLNDPICNVGSGASFAPLLFTNIATELSNFVQREFPAEPENIFRGELKSGEHLPDGMKPPVRVQYRDSITENQAKDLFGEGDDGKFIVKDADGNEIEFVWDVPKDGLAKRVTAEPFISVSILVNNPSRFRRNVGDIETALGRLEDELFTELKKYHTRMSVGQALANVRWMSIILFQKAQVLVGERGDSDEVRDWGVAVQSVALKSINNGYGLNLAIQQNAQAPFERDTAIVASEGERTKLINEGEGKARAAADLERQTLKARATGVKVVAKAAGSVELGQETLANETARALGTGDNTIIAGASSGLADLLAVGTALRKEKGKTD